MLLPAFFSFTPLPAHHIYTLSLHDALPISQGGKNPIRIVLDTHLKIPVFLKDRKSTRLNSSHVAISYAVFCLKKKTLTPHIKNKYTNHHGNIRKRHSRK